MNVTEVRIKMPSPGENPRLLAYCSLVLDGEYAVHDLKLIQGNSGVILSMPSRRLMDRCPVCGCPNDLRSSYCGRCGLYLEQPEHGPVRADVFHPLSNPARLRLQHAVQAEYDKQLVLSMSGG